MPVRRFDGVDDVVRLAAGATAITGAVTIAVVCRVSRAPPGDWMTLVHTGGDSLNQGYSLQVPGWGAAWALFADDDDGTEDGPAVGGSDGWVLLCAAKPSGTATPRFHRYVFATRAWTRADGSRGTRDATGPSPGGVDIGGMTGTPLYPFAGDVAAVGVWGQALNDTQVDALVAGTIQDWLRIGTPLGVWAFDQASTAEAVRDLTGGGADQRAIRGTTVVNEDPPIPYAPEPSGPTVPELDPLRRVLFDASEWPDGPISSSHGWDWYWQLRVEGGVLRPAVDGSWSDGGWSQAWGPRAAGWVEVVSRGRFTLNFDDEAPQAIHYDEGWLVLEDGGEELDAVEIDVEDGPLMDGDVVALVVDGLDARVMVARDGGTPYEVLSGTLRQPTLGEFWISMEGRAGIRRVGGGPLPEPASGPTVWLYDGTRLVRCEVRNSNGDQILLHMGAANGR